MNQVNRDIPCCDRGLRLRLCFAVSVIRTGHATLAMSTADEPGTLLEHARTSIDNKTDK